MPRNTIPTPVIPELEVATIGTILNTIDKQVTESLDNANQVTLLADTKAELLAFIDANEERLATFATFTSFKPSAIQRSANRKFYIPFWNSAIDNVEKVLKAGFVLPSGYKH